MLRVASLAIALSLVLTSFAAVPASAALPAEIASGAASDGCTDSVGPGIAAPASVATGTPGYHAAFYGQSGYPTLCPGHTSVATVAFMNTGTLGWYAGAVGKAAFLGTAGPEPGQDKPSALGGVDTGWPAANRIASQPAAYVGPGQVSWFQFTVRAPMTPGIYRLALRPLIEGTQWLEDYGLFWYVTVKEAGTVATAPVTPVAAVTPVAPVTPVTTAAPARTNFPVIASDGSRSIRVNALMFHRVSWLPPNADPLRKDLTVTPTDFEEMLKYLKANGYNTITSADLWWSLDTGKPLPPKPVLLSFDDGYVDHSELVMPLLKAYGMVGTFAVTANLIDKPGYMTKTMVRALSDGGMEIVSHGTDHWSVNSLGYQQQLYQLCTSRRILSDWAGKDVRHFVYPSGDYLPLPSAALQNCGYLSAYRKDGGSIESSNDMYALRRVRIRGQQGLGALLFALTQ
ncbi:MAG: polysaccharide deacetylase family protein [Chloroflexi bacterium]|nr:polysaccharide deacetylase family protein [Chloroflexota bacterium]